MVHYCEHPGCAPNPDRKVKVRVRAKRQVLVGAPGPFQTKFWLCGAHFGECVEQTRASSRDERLFMQVVGEA